MDRHFTSIYREIKRGTIELINSDLTTYKKYCSDVGQRKMIEKGHNKGRDLKIGNDLKTVKFVENALKVQRHAPYQINVAMKLSECLTVLSVSTIYNYLHNGIFLNLSEKDMIYNKKYNHKKEVEKRPQYNKSLKKSIEERPDEINKRDCFGHWEIDTVYSGKDKSKECLLVLTERFTRLEIIKKLPNRKADSVLSAINKIEKEYGYRKFKDIFKTITADNGTEFSKHVEIEQSVISKNKRTTIYFCHAFASCERGSNENANKLIRKYIKKGEDIANFTHEQIKHIQDIINNYPRKMFGGLSANQYALSKNLPLV